MRPAGLLIAPSLLLMAALSAARLSDGECADLIAPSAALRQLASPEPREVAWGARFAGETGLREAVPGLLAVLRREAGAELDRESLFLRATVLDALIRLGAEVPAADLLPHAKDLLVPAVVIALSRRPADHRPELSRLFDELETGDPDAWLAAGNLLFALRAPEFAARLLGRLRMDLRVRVFSDDKPCLEPGGSVTGCSYADVPEGWPPLAVYKLGGPPPSDWPASLPPLLPRFLVADGIRPIFARRVGGERVWFCCAGDGTDRDECRAEWLAELLRGARAKPGKDDVRRRRWWRLRPLDLPLDLGPPARIVVDVRWTGRQPFLRQVRAEEEALRATFRDGVRHLAAAGVLTREEGRALRPEVRVTVDDRRTDRRAPLPPLAPLSAARGTPRRRAAGGFRPGFRGRPPGGRGAARCPRGCSRCGGS
ncbi:MAG: hypothetical protein MUE73_00175 [Planctomycetes bacterium]|jgi:hypothetical protein|nr:hypothetical protein [Planctomycetota bacterium]